MITVSAPRPLECSKICTLLTLRYTNRYCQFILIFVFVGMEWCIFLLTKVLKKKKKHRSVSIYSRFCLILWFWYCILELFRQCDFFFFFFYYSPMLDSQYDQIDLNDHLHFFLKKKQCSHTCNKFDAVKC